MTETKKKLSEIGYYPMREDVIIGFVEIETTTKSGIIKSDEMLKEDERNMQSQESHKVLAIGPDQKLISIGDNIVIRPESYPILIIGGNKYVQLDTFNVLGIIKK